MASELPRPGDGPTVETPKPTVWPMVLGLGVALLAAGVATSPAFLALGGLILVAGLVGWVGGATAYHQHHPVHSPPVEHVDAILRNGARFARRWGWWPMTGWLEEMERLGVVRRDAATGRWSRAPLSLAGERP